MVAREEIMAMPAGPDIDRLVAEALGETEAEWHSIARYRHLCYSTDIATAWKAWEAIQQKAQHVQFRQEGQLCEVSIIVSERKGPYFIIDAPTVPLAICRAFLVWKLEEGRQ